MQCGECRCEGFASQGTQKSLFFGAFCSVKIFLPTVFVCLQICKHHHGRRRMPLFSHIFSNKVYVALFPRVMKCAVQFQKVVGVRNVL